MFIQLDHLRNLIIDADNIHESYYSDKKYRRFIQQDLKKLNVIIIFRNPWYKSYFQSLDIHNNFIYKEVENPFFFIDRFLHGIDLHLYESAIITGNQQMVRTVHNQCMSTILLTRDLSNMEHTGLPDHIVVEPEDLKGIFNEPISGYYNEMAAENLKGTGHTYKLGEIRHFLFPDIKASLLVGGRYFTSKDHRAYTHCLTNKILKLKDCNPVIIDHLSGILNQNLQTVNNLWGNIDIITTVPPKPNGKNHLGLLLNSKSLNDFRDLIDTDILYTIKDYPKQKTAGNWENRANNVLDVFASRRNVRGHIVIVDDILTSGSTTLECARILFENGAEKVSIVPLAVMQSQINNQNVSKVTCSNCNEGVFKLRFNNKDGNFFWACNQYPHCTNTKNYYKIKNRYISQLTIDVGEEETLF
ncbi:hypothetical protein COM78_20350 [Bacillus thuringiensis]|uniref:ComF family protein n=1 Tax=Bacillus thuringiensis TaxID=1428 RepID=UPI000BED4596|nr:hypothetical protein [Bacillus thuringiensis]PDX93001.1 hypothetical protein COM78_20350 [Bacillus thuringiensis]